MNTYQAAKYAGCTRKLIVKEIKRGKLNARTTERGYKTYYDISKEDIEQWKKLRILDRRNKHINIAISDYDFNILLSLSTDKSYASTISELLRKEAQKNEI